MRFLGIVRVSSKIVLADFRNPDCLSREIKVKPTTRPRRSITQVLNDWLERNHDWDYQEVHSLLDELESKGYAHLTDNEDGRKAIEEYLENHKYPMAAKETAHPVAK